MSVRRNVLVCQMILVFTVGYLARVEHLSDLIGFFIAAVGMYFVPVLLVDATARWQVGMSLRAMARSLRADVGTPEAHAAAARMERDADKITGIPRTPDADDAVADRTSEEVE